MISLLLIIAGLIKLSSSRSLLQLDPVTSCCLKIVDGDDIRNVDPYGGGKPYVILKSGYTGFGAPTEIGRTSAVSGMPNPSFDEEFCGGGNNQIEALRYTDHEYFQFEVWSKMTMGGNDMLIGTTKRQEIIGSECCDLTTQNLELSNDGGTLNVKIACDYTCGEGKKYGRGDVKPCLGGGEWPTENPTTTKPTPTKPTEKPTTTKPTPTKPTTTSGSCGHKKSCYVTIKSGSNLKSADRDSYSDPFVVMYGKYAKRSYKNYYLFKTSTQWNNENSPVWNEGYYIRDVKFDYLYFQVYDEDVSSPRDWMGDTNYKDVKLDKLPCNEKNYLTLYLDNDGDREEGSLDIIVECTCKKSRLLR